MNIKNNSKKTKFLLSLGVFSLFSLIPVSIIACNNLENNKDNSSSQANKDALEELEKGGTTTKGIKTDSFLSLVESLELSPTTSLKNLNIANLNTLLQANVDFNKLNLTIKFTDEKLGKLQLSLKGSYKGIKVENKTITLSSFEKIDENPQILEELEKGGTTTKGIKTDSFLSLVESLELNKLSVLRNLNNNELNTKLHTNNDFKDLNLVINSWDESLGKLEFKISGSYQGAQLAADKKIAVSDFIVYSDIKDKVLNGLVIDKEKYFKDITAVPTKKALSLDWLLSYTTKESRNISLKNSQVDFLEYIRQYQDKNKKIVFDSPPTSNNVLRIKANLVYQKKEANSATISKQEQALITTLGSLLDSPTKVDALNYMQKFVVFKESAKNNFASSYYAKLLNVQNNNSATTQEIANSLFDIDLSQFTNYPQFFSTYFPTAGNTDSFEFEINLNSMYVDDLSSLLRISQSIVYKESQNSAPVQSSYKQRESSSFKLLTEAMLEPYNSTSSSNSKGEWKLKAWTNPSAALSTLQKAINQKIKNEFTTYENLKTQASKAGGAQASTQAPTLDPSNTDLEVVLYNSSKEIQNSDKDLKIFKNYLADQEFRFFKNSKNTFDTKLSPSIKGLYKYDANDPNSQLYIESISMKMANKPVISYDNNSTFSYTANFKITIQFANEKIKVYDWSYTSSIPDSLMKNQVFKTTKPNPGDYVDPKDSFEIVDIGKTLAKDKRIGIWNTTLNKLDQDAFFLPASLSNLLPSEIKVNQLDKLYTLKNSKTEKPSVEIVDYNDFGLGNVVSISYNADGSPPNENTNNANFTMGSAHIEIKFSFNKWGPNKQPYSRTVKFYSRASTVLTTRFPTHGSGTLYAKLPNELRDNLKKLGLNSNAFIHDGGMFIADPRTITDNYFNYLLQLKRHTTNDAFGKITEFKEENMDIKTQYPQALIVLEKSIFEPSYSDKGKTISVKKLVLRNFATKEQYTVKRGSANWAIVFQNMPGLVKPPDAQ